MQRLFLICILVGLLCVCTAQKAQADQQALQSKKAQAVWIWKHLGEFAQSCIRSAPDCSEPALQKSLLELSSYLPNKALPDTDPWNQLIVFASEKQNPGMFDSASGEVHRVAMTQSQRFSKIYLNEDRLPSLDVTALVGILTHEAVHHLGYADDPSRLTDQVGAALANHFQRGLSVSSLEEFGHPELTVTVFNSPSGVGVSPVLILAGTYSIDQSTEPGWAWIECPAGTKFEGENIGALLWRSVHVDPQTGVARIHGSSQMEARCRAPGAGKATSVVSVFTVRLDLKYLPPLDLKTDWWNSQSEIDVLKLMSGIDTSGGAAFDLDRGFIVKSQENSSSVLKAGEVWTAKFILQPINNAITITGCTATFTGASWMFFRAMSIPWWVNFDHCGGRKLPDGTYEITATTKIPPNTQPDFFTVPILRFETSVKDLYAVPSEPKYIEVENENAAPRTSVSAFRVLGLEPAAIYEGAPLKNSYRVQRGKPFWIEFDLIGSQSLESEILDFDLFSRRPGTSKIVIRPMNMPVEKLKPYFVVESEHIPIDGGTRVRYLIQVPRNIEGGAVEGMKFRGLYIQTGDGSWAKIESPGGNEFLFLGENLYRVLEDSAAPTAVFDGRKL